MAGTIEGYFLAVERRARLLRGLARMWPLEGGALLLTLGYLLAEGFGLLTLVGKPGAGVGPHWPALGLGLGLGNLLVAVGGFLWGYHAPVRLERLLYQVDRRLGLGERLSSLWELHQGRGPRELIPLISRGLPELGRLPLKRALPLRWRERLGLTLVGLLAALCLWSSLGPSLLPSGLPWAPPARARRGLPPREQEGLLGLRPEVLQRLALIEEELTRLEGLAREPSEGAGMGELPLRAGEELPALREELVQLEGELQGQGPGRPSPRSGARKGLPLAELGEHLAELLSALEGLEPGEPPPPELGERLARLAEELGLTAELAEVLAPEGAGGGEMELTQLQRGLAMRLAEVERLQGLARRLSALESSLALERGERPARRGERPESGGRGRLSHEGEPGGPGSTSPAGEGGSPPEEGRAEPAEPEAGAIAGAFKPKRGQPSGRFIEGGEEAGTAPGPELGPGQGEGGLLSPPEGARELRISGMLTELGELERLLTKGVPFEPESKSGLEGEGGGGEGPLALRLDFHRVRAILSSRGLPEELQELVKRYFLTVTETEAGR